jgi:hypothetical protein
MAGGFKEPAIIELDPLLIVVIGGGGDLICVIASAMLRSDGLGLRP